MDHCRRDTGWNIVGCTCSKRKVRKLSQSILGTSGIVEGINRISDDVSRTPKSVSGMTRIMEPQIKRDFPEFVWEQFKNKAEIMLVSGTQCHFIIRHGPACTECIG